MTSTTKTALSILTSGFWITLSEFVRNELLLKSYWIDHYRSLGLEFPSEAANGLIWVLWSFVFAAYIVVISRKFSFRETLAISWVSGFVLMWIVTGNMAVLPLGILKFAIPMSLFEVGLALLIIGKISPAQKS